MNIISRSYTESSPHIHDFQLRLNARDFILVRVFLTSITPRVAVWLDQDGNISHCSIEWPLLMEIMAEALKKELNITHKGD